MRESDRKRERESNIKRERGEREERVAERERE